MKAGRKALSLVPVFLVAILVMTFSTHAGTYSYRETVGDQVTPFTWSIEEEWGVVTITSYTERKSFVNRCLPSGDTVEWVIKDQAAGHDIRAIREKNLLHIRGTRKGKKYEETVALGSKPWYQPLSFSLHRFLRSSGNSISFWTVRSDKIEPIELEAVKKGEEKLQHNGKIVLAQKIEVRPTGLFSLFWHGTYWYRKSDQQFLLYRSVHGLPGTPETTVELITEPKAPSGGNVSGAEKKG